MASSKRGHAKPTAAAQAYAIRGTRVDEPKASKLTRAEQRRREHNERLRKPKCIGCTGPRESKQGLWCAKCEKERANA